MIRFVRGCHRRGAAGRPVGARLAAHTAGLAVLATGLLLGAVPAVAVGASAGEVGLVSHTPLRPTTTADGQSAFATTSADGAYVAFASGATDLVPGQTDANGAQDVFLFERATGAVTLVSHVPSSGSTTAGLASGFPRVSADGGFVLFHSYADDLLAGQSGARGNVFLFERATGRVTLVSHTSAGATTAAGDSYQIAAINADGSYVAFQSYGSDLVLGQDEAGSGVSNDVFLFERATGRLTLVSHVAGGPTTAAGQVYDSPSMSADGTDVAFTSGAADLVPNQADSGYSGGDVFLFDRVTGEVTLVSHVPGRPEVTGNAPSGSPVVSGNGEFVLLESSATDLVGGSDDSNGTFDVFLFERATGAMTLVSHTPDSATTTGDNSSHSAFDISADGSYATLSSFATNLVAGQVDANGSDDVFLYQRGTGTVTLASHTPNSPVTAADGVSQHPAMSSDGASVAFMSEAGNLVPGQRDNRLPTSDIFLFGRRTGTTTLVSHVPKRLTTTANGASGLRPGGRGPEIDAPRISASGGVVAFVSLATDLVARQTDTNGLPDTFVFVRN